MEEQIGTLQKTAGRTMYRLEVKSFDGNWYLVREYRNWRNAYKLCNDLYNSGRLARIIYCNNV